MAEGQYFLKDKKIEIFKRLFLNPNDCNDESYAPYRPGKTWAYTNQKGQDTDYRARALTQKESRFFVIGFTKGLDVRDKILYKGVWHEITRVDTADGYNTDMFVYADRYPHNIENTYVIHEYNPELLK